MIKMTKSGNSYRDNTVLSVTDTISTSLNAVDEFSFSSYIGKLGYSGNSESELKQKIDLGITSILKEVIINTSITPFKCNNGEYNYFLPVDRVIQKCE